MASPQTYDLFSQETNTLSSVHVLNIVKTMGVTSLGPHTRPACTQVLRGSIKLCEECGSNACVCLFFTPWGHVNFYDHIWTLWRHISHVGSMLRSDWLIPNFLRSDWLQILVACNTTPMANCAWKNVCCLNKFRTKRKFREDFEYGEEETGTFHDLSKSTH